MARQTPAVTASITRAEKTSAALALTAMATPRPRDWQRAEDALVMIHRTMTHARERRRHAT